MSGAEVPSDRGDDGTTPQPGFVISSEQIESVLDSFREWLTALRHEPELDEEVTRSEFDLHTLVSQFTALRHDVNLQTRATRASTEQTTEIIRLFAERPKPAEDPLRPLLFAIVETADALLTAQRQAVKAVATVLPEPSAAQARVINPPRRGFWSRLFSSAQNCNDASSQAATTGAVHLASLLGSIADGYSMSLRRMDRLLASQDVEPIPTSDRPFDAETMEVVEVVWESGRPVNTVVEEVRRGYRRKGLVFRFAQVKVAR